MSEVTLFVIVMYSKKVIFPWGSCYPDIEKNQIFNTELAVPLRPKSLIHYMKIQDPIVLVYNLELLKHMEALINGK